MTFTVHGQAVSRGIAIGRAVLVASSRMDVAHYFVTDEQVHDELRRLRTARDAVVAEITRVQHGLQETTGLEAPHELTALLDVHLMLLQDEDLIAGVKHWITDRLYNAEWALTTQLEVLSRQFDEMEDEYLRERKADLEQVAERILRYMKGVASPVAAPPSRKGAARQQDLLLDGTVDVPLVLVAHDLSPADMLQFKQSVFAGFVTDVGGKTSHTAIVARSLDIPADWLVAALAASWSSRTAFREKRSHCSTAATRKAGCWKRPCSTPVFRTGCTAACAFLSGPRSRTRWRICASWRTRTMTPAFCGW